MTETCQNRKAEGKPNLECTWHGRRLPMHLGKRRLGIVSNSGTDGQLQGKHLRANVFKYLDFYFGQASHCDWYQADF
jgi:hypothetical protein